MPQFDETQIQQTANIYTGIGLDTVLDQAIAIMGECKFVLPEYVSRNVDLCFLRSHFYLPYLFHTRCVPRAFI